MFCVHSEPNYSLPWQRKRQFSSTGSGFIISGRRILTNAHCVDHHSQVKLRRRHQTTDETTAFEATACHTADADAPDAVAVQQSASHSSIPWRMLISTAISTQPIAINSC